MFKILVYILIGGLQVLTILYKFDCVSLASRDITSLDQGFLLLLSSTEY